MTTNSELVYTTSSPALIASEVARRTITETVAANAARLIAREAVDNDDLTPVGYDNHGSPIYPWQETP